MTTLSTLDPQSWNFLPTYAWVNNSSNLFLCYQWNGTMNIRQNMPFVIGNIVGWNIWYAWDFALLLYIALHCSSLNNMFRSVIDSHYLSYRRNTFCLFSSNNILWYWHYLCCGRKVNTKRLFLLLCIYSGSSRSLYHLFS